MIVVAEYSVGLLSLLLKGFTDVVKELGWSPLPRPSRSKMSVLFAEGPFCVNCCSGLDVVPVLLVDELLPKESPSKSSRMSWFETVLSGVELSLGEEADVGSADPAKSELYSEVVRAEIFMMGIFSSRAALR